MRFDVPEDRRKFLFDSELKARTALAAEIAGINPLRLNEAVSAGFYPCAPETRAGAARVFDVNDLVALTVYRHLLDEGMTQRAAGPVACGLRELLRREPDALVARWVKTAFGDDGWCSESGFSPGDDFFLGGDVVSFREWRLGMIKARIVHKLQAAAKVVG